MKRAYERWSPRGASLTLVTTAEQICNEYRADGYTLTLRQLYYQFVARGIIPNSDRSYSNLGGIIDRARKAGWLDWRMIEDRTRNLQGLSHWDTPADVIAAARRSYAIDQWEDQPTRVEVWVEKEALAGIVKRAADRWDCSWFSCRGYVSQSEMWNAAQRLGGYIDEGQRVVILHLGDHDPSGIDMTRDITERLERYVRGDIADTLGWGSIVDDENREDVEMELVDRYNRRAEEREFGDEWGEAYDFMGDVLDVRRIALNIDQVRRYDPPPNPAKLSDSRSSDYIDRYGAQSWELDALTPQVLADLIDTSIAGIVDMDRMEAKVARQDDERTALELLEANWADVSAQLIADEDDA